MPSFLALALKSVKVGKESKKAIELANITIEKAGYRLNIETCPSGEASIKSFQENKHTSALILLDLKMPGWIGIETLQKIRAAGRFSYGTWIVVISSSLQSDEDVS